MRSSLLAGILMPALALGACAPEHVGPEISIAAIDAERTRLAALRPAAAPAPTLARPDLVAALAALEDAAQPHCATHPERCDFSLWLIGDEEVNAWINADHRITVTRGLLDRCASVDEAAFVLAHEMAHGIAGHVGEAELRARVGAVVLQGALIAAGALAGFAPSAGDLRGVGELGADLGARVYGQPEEIEADVLAFRLTTAAGYAPDAGTSFFERLARTEFDRGDAGWLARHPSHAERIVRLEALAAEG